MGDADLVRALGLAGIRSVVAAPPGDTVLSSRFARRRLSWVDDPEQRDEIRVEALLRFGTAQREPAVLFYQTDEQLRLVSRHRERLGQYFRFVIAGTELIEDLTDKARFQELAKRAKLPVPDARRLVASGNDAPNIDLRYPLIMKPTVHNGSLSPWEAIAGGQKALLIENREDLQRLWPFLASAGIGLLVQEAIPGPESQIESYHVYVDDKGAIVGEFTGRKIRTYPVTCGPSSALETTNAEDVRALGREIVQSLNLHGVAKLDFKRGPQGKLFLLEINPRFNLWHYLGAVAGVNLPALVYADLMKLPRQASLDARAGVCWSRLGKDIHAARACGVTVTEWLWWALHCKAKSPALDDPLPLFRETWRLCHA
jgi:predicted ATP-grasp superfamily ATP-dependent carboligase